MECYTLSPEESESGLSIISSDSFKLHYDQVEESRMTDHQWTTCHPRPTYVSVVQVN